MLDYDANTETYLRSDISNALNALAETVEMYRTGYYAALRAAARAFRVKIDAGRDVHSGRLIDVTPRRQALRGGGG